MVDMRLHMLADGREIDAVAVEAEVLKELGSEKAWVVHGADGMDELTLCGKTYVAKLENGEITTFEVTPEDAGLEQVPPQMLTGGDLAVVDAIKLGPAQT